MEKSGYFPDMDNIDRNILSLLRADSTATVARLGERVGLSPSAAHRRVKLLEAAGYISGYRARLSMEARGNPTSVFVSVTLKDQTQETLTRFEAALARRSDIEEAHLMSGDSDYLLKINVRAGESFERIHRDVLAQLPGVQRLVSQFAIRTIVDAQ
jgi:Lrp/AsnC family leucine-responsive transcriptional regulator